MSMEKNGNKITNKPFVYSITGQSLETLSRWIPLDVDYNHEKTRMKFAMNNAFCRGRRRRRLWLTQFTPIGSWKSSAKNWFSRICMLFFSQIL